MNELGLLPDKRISGLIQITRSKTGLQSVSSPKDEFV